MTRITGTEPQHWHATGDAGRHTLKDPRLYTGYPRRRWSPEERAYVAHLEAHEVRDRSLKPLDTDHELVRVCLGHIASEELRLTSLRALVLELREDLARGVPIEESAAANTLATQIPSLMHTAVVGENG